MNFFKKLIYGPSVPKSSAASLLEQIASQYFQQTDPVRQSLIGRSSDFLSGDLDVTQSPMFGAIKAANESQFGRARDNALSSLPSGGGLTSALVGLEGQKADSMTDAIGSLAGDELNRASGFANPQVSISGLAGAGAIQGQQALAQAQQNSAAKAMIGEGGGRAAAGGKPTPKPGG